MKSNAISGWTMATKPQNPRMTAPPSSCETINQGNPREKGAIEGAEVA